jgi:hypothetical protein
MLDECLQRLKEELEKSGYLCRKQWEQIIYW